MPKKKQRNNDKMSRQPPLPPGPPPRSRNGYGNGDSYRPQSDYYYEREPEQMYQFRGAPSNSHNSYRPSYDQPSYDSRPRYDNYAPSISPPRGPANDSYRDRGPPSAFDFRHDAPPALEYQASNRPRSPPRQRTIHQDGNSGYRGRVDNTNNRGATRGGYRGRAGPRMASDREFLKTNRAPTPELMPGMDDDQANAVKYVPMEDVSDSEEAEMDLSNDEGAEPKKKQARTQTLAADGDSVPKWSNPDPYTVLPPLDEAQRKKKDVVKLIRKARVAAAAENINKPEAVTDDFISFDFDDQDDSSMLAKQPGNGVEGAPTGPRFSHRDNTHKQEQQSGSLNQFRENQQAQIAKHAADDSKQQQPQTANNHSLNEKLRQPVQPNKPQHPLPSKPVPHIDLTPNPDLGNRKRTIRDEIKGPLKAPPDLHSIGGKKPPSTGEIVKTWKIQSSVSPTPWVSVDHSDSANMGIWLHKEIMDFYHFVKPRSFEQFIRTQLVEQLRSNVKQFFDREADIRTFGSFPAGLYLPTSDMDLVCVSDTYMKGGNMIFGKGKNLYKFDAFLKHGNLSMPGKTEIIPRAKVPLVKYVDRVTGLKIDVSFENDTGLIANRTFQEWKATFPAMPILVTLIKHLLAMRGLNEPVNGGIGGFSVTCLVVSLLQNMPQVQSGSMIPEHHLGEILMEFLDLYGNQFNFATTAIQLNPPGYISKGDANIPYKNKLAIIDPNRASNDIAGGSSNTDTILKCFSKSYDALQKRMGELQYSANRRKQSILGCIIGGNYTSFKLQREHLAHVHENLYGPVDLE
ncbi:hypothetical protein N431DRAFT_401649 [Stipitochalara longipes BDJ]|nr:hypothetical protein N431DRAFT_401649 [Stipitochalara longipes BDJ]